jgi:hypothetical protein
MYHGRFISRRVAEIANANPEVRDRGSAFWDFPSETYAATQAMAARRQAVTDPDACSLALVIEQMGNSARALTRESCVSLFDQDDDLPLQRRIPGLRPTGGQGRTEDVSGWRPSHKEVSDAVD